MSMSESARSSASNSDTPPTSTADPHTDFHELPLTEIRPHLFLVAPGYKLSYGPDSGVAESCDEACSTISSRARVLGIPLVLVPATFRGYDEDVDPFPHSVRSFNPIVVPDQFRGQIVLHISTAMADRVITLPEDVSPLPTIHLLSINTPFYQEGLCNSRLSVQLTPGAQRALKVAATLEPATQLESGLFLVSGHAILDVPDQDRRAFKASVPFFSPSPTVLGSQRDFHGVTEENISELQDALQKKRAILGPHTGKTIDDVPHEMRKGPWNRPNLERYREDEARIAEIFSLHRSLPDAADNSPAALRGGITLCAESTCLSVASEPPALPAATSVPTMAKQEDPTLAPSSSIPLALEATRNRVAQPYDEPERTLVISDWGLVLAHSGRSWRPTYPHIAADPDFWAVRALRKLQWENDRSGGPHLLETGMSEAWIVLPEVVEREGLPLVRCTVGFTPKGHKTPARGDSGTAVTLDGALLDGSVIGPKPVGVILGGPAARSDGKVPYTFIRDLAQISRRMAQVLHLSPTDTTSITYAVSDPRNEEQSRGLTR
ncbi:hypothetical protein B0H17DRAFT_1071900 [Mycena rosella]|uniref:Uncharacterized protein n=1 Tax=Mycena rosella TaxID=1033263 RepID=A0AAD7DBD5_MYCRO|nr:hypothetical protein B0H17DRAFT_1071900 [Mycena rosella]